MCFGSFSVVSSWLVWLCALCIACFKSLKPRPRPTLCNFLCIFLLLLLLSLLQRATETHTLCTLFHISGAYSFFFRCSFCRSKCTHIGCFIDFLLLIFILALSTFAAHPSRGIIFIEFSTFRIQPQLCCTSKWLLLPLSVLGICACRTLDDLLFYSRFYCSARKWIQVKVKKSNSICLRLLSID